MYSHNHVGWFDIYVNDMARAKQFYETVFNVTLVDMPSEWGKQAAFPFDEQQPFISGALVERKDNISTGNNIIIYFETVNCVEEEQRIEQAGGKILQPKMDIGQFGFVSIFQDTEGNTIGLHSLQ